MMLNLGKDLLCIFKKGLSDLGGRPSGVMTIHNTSRDSLTQSNGSRSLIAGNTGSSEKICETEELVPEVNMEVETDRVIYNFISKDCFTRRRKYIFFTLYS